MSKDLIPISATGQGSISNDMEIGASINGDTSIDHHSPTAKCDTSMYKCRIVLNATFPSDKNTPVIRMNKKKNGTCHRILHHSFLLQFTGSVVYSLQAQYCLAVNLTHTISWQAYRPTAWSQFQTVCIKTGANGQTKVLLKKRVFVFWYLSPLALNINLH